MPPPRARNAYYVVCMHYITANAVRASRDRARFSRRFCGPELPCIMRENPARRVPPPPRGRAAPTEAAAQRTGGGDRVYEQRRAAPASARNLAIRGALGRTTRAARRRINDAQARLVRRPFGFQAQTAFQLQARDAPAAQGAWR